MPVWNLEQHLRPSRKITTEEELRHSLEELPLEEDPHIILEEAGADLSIAVNGQYACVIYHPGDGSSLTATLTPADQLKPDYQYPDEEWIEFIVGGTRTPIPKAYCVPHDIMMRIAIHFFRDQKLPEFVRWVE